MRSQEKDRSLSPPDPPVVAHLYITISNVLHRKDAKGLSITTLNGCCLALCAGARGRLIARWFIRLSFSQLCYSMPVYVSVLLAG